MLVRLSAIALLGLCVLFGPQRAEAQETGQITDLSTGQARTRLGRDGPWVARGKDWFSLPMPFVTDQIGNLIVEKGGESHTVLRRDVVVSMDKASFVCDRKPATSQTVIAGKSGAGAGGCIPVQVNGR